MKHLLINSAVIASVLTLGACSTLQPGTTTEDGLVAQDSPVFDELYLRPGANLSQYSSYGLENCEVTFRKDWQRDQNQNRPDISNRVTQKNIDEITESISKSCNTYLERALQEEPMLTLAQPGEAASGVLTVRPSVIDLDINAPDTDGPGIVRSFTTSFGEMTLVLELADAATGEVLARAVDKRRGPERGYLQRTNSVTNQFETNRILRNWSKQVRASLDGGIASS